MLSSMVVPPCSSTESGMKMVCVRMVCLLRSAWSLCKNAVLVLAPSCMDHARGYDEWLVNPLRGDKRPLSHDLNTSWLLSDQGSRRLAARFEPITLSPIGADVLVAVVPILQLLAQIEYIQRN